MENELSLYVMEKPKLVSNVKEHNIMDECRFLNNIVDKMIDALETEKEYEINSYTISNGKNLDTELEVIAKDIRKKTDDFMSEYKGEKVILYIRLIADVSIPSVRILNDELPEDINIDFRVISKENRVGKVLTIIVAERGIEDQFLHISNVDALNTDLTTAAEYVKTTDGETINIRPIDTSIYEGKSLQDNLWKEVLNSLDE